MRSPVLALIVALAVVGVATPSWACMYHDQQAASDTQQQTAQAQPAQPSQTATQ